MKFGFEVIAQVNRLDDFSLHCLDQLNFLLHPAGVPRALAVAEDESLAGFDFVADEFGQAGGVCGKAIEEEQQRMVSAPLEFVVDLAHLLQVTARMGDENPYAVESFSSPATERPRRRVLELSRRETRQASASWRGR